MPFLLRCLFWGLLWLCSSFAVKAQSFASFPALHTQLLGRWSFPDSTEIYSGLATYAADGREYAIIGTRTGTAFVEVTLPDQPRLIAHIPGRRPTDLGGRSYQTYQHYAYGVADEPSGHSLQVFDMQFLPDSVRLVLDDDAQTVGARRVKVGSNRLWLVSNMRDSAGINHSSLRVLSLAQPENPTYFWEDNYYLRISNILHDALIEEDTVILAIENTTSLGRAIIDNHPVREPYPMRNSPYLFQTSSSCTNISSDTGRHWVLTLHNELGDSSLTLFPIVRHRGILNRTLGFAKFGLPNLIRPHRAVLLDNRQYAVVAYQQEGVQIWSLADSARPVRTAYLDTYPTSVGPPDYQRVAGCQEVAVLPSGLLLATDYAGGLFVVAPPWPWTPLPRLPAPTWHVGVWPNPVTAANGAVQIALSYSPTTLRIETLDIFGRNVHPALSWANPAKVVSLTLAGLAPGTYWLRLLRPDEPPLLRRVTIAPD